MIISPVTFSSQFDNFALRPQMPQDTAKKVQVVEPKQNKKSEIKKYTLIGTGILLAAILILKGKFILGLFKKKPQTSGIKPEVPDIKPTTEPTPAPKPDSTKMVKKPLPPRYELLEDYEKITKERTEFRNRTRGRELTPEEITERDALRNNWNAIKSKLRMEHQSIILKKSAAEFTTEGEKKDYIMKYVLPRMSETEESAFDALDMFEEFGFRAEYPSKLNTTISKLSEGVIGLPNQAKTDKMLARYLQVFDKYATNTPERHPDDEALGWVISDFCDNGCDISENSIIRGINIMKRVACQRWDYENLDNTLVSAYGAKFKDNQNVKNALLELKDAVKNLKYRLEAGDR